MHFSCSILITGVLSLNTLAQQTLPPVQPPSGTAQTGATSPQTPTTPSQTPADKPAAVSSDTYILGPGDTIALNVWREPNFSAASTPVRPDGQISLPLLGDVAAAGMTPMVLGQDIAGRLKKYVNDPLVTITVLGVTPKEVYLIGEIGKTGPVTLTPGMNLLQVIAVAGGLSPYAKKKLYVLRKTPKGDQKLFFDYKKALKSGDQQGITLVPGDTIVVP